MNVSLSDAEMGRLQAVKQQHGWSYIETLLRAVAFVRDDPSAVVDEDDRDEDPELGGFILARTNRRGPARRTRVWRTYPENVQRIDELAEQSGADSRDQFLRAALIHFLDAKGL